MTLDSIRNSMFGWLFQYFPFDARVVMNTSDASINTVCHTHQKLKGRVAGNFGDHDILEISHGVEYLFKDLSTVSVTFANKSILWNKIRSKRHLI